MQAPAAHLLLRLRVQHAHLRSLHDAAQLVQAATVRVQRLGKLIIQLRIPSPPGLQSSEVPLLPPQRLS